MQLAPLTLEVEQQHAAALAEFIAAAGEPFATPAHRSDQGASAAVQSRRSDWDMRRKPPVV